MNRQVPPAPKSGVRLRQLELVFEPRAMVAGDGERHETCVHYDDCLGDWVRRDPRFKDLTEDEKTRVKGYSRGRRELPAQCPVACPHKRDIPKAFHIAVASIGGTHPLSGVA